jgi:transcription elongation factor Elf1
MSLYVDKKYVGLLSPKLSNFKAKSEFLWNFRCPYCGDSSKNKTKARGYIYRKKSDLFYMCHNCGASTTFTKLVKHVDPALYSPYILEKYQNGSLNKAVEQPDFSHVKSEKQVEFDLPTIESLPRKHPARAYLEGRKIPQEHYNNIFFSDDYKALSEVVCQYKEKTISKTDERIVIPFRDVDGSLMGVQGRALDDSKIRYILIKVYEDSKKVYGLDKIDFDKPIYVVEGPFDSMFLANSIALMDAQLYRVASVTGLPDKKYILVYDNEPRNSDIVKHMRKSISMGFDVCVWPSHIEEKDINDMILSGYTQSILQAVIDKNTFNGMQAQIMFDQWRKV